jgi:uncharacterized protein YcnI
MATASASRNNRRVRRFLIPFILALILVPTAAAHVTITPTRASPGSDVLLTFVVPNEDDSAVIGGVTIEVPKSFSVEGIEAPPGWRQQDVVGRIAWVGGRIQPGRFATFSITGSAPRQPATLTFPVSEVFRGERTEAYRPQLVVASPTPAAARDRSSHTLAKAALFAAIAAGAIAVAAFFLALAHWLRGSDKLQES